MLRLLLTPRAWPAAILFVLGILFLAETNLLDVAGGLLCIPVFILALVVGGYIAQKIEGMGKGD